MLNNPIVRSDPSGHKEVSEVDGGIPCYPGELACQLKKSGETENEFKKDVMHAADDLIWLAVPSAIGIDFGIQGQYGLLAEVEVTPVEIQLIYNWRSKQLSVFKGSGTGGYLGSPNILGGTGYLGIMTVYGASDNRYIAGHSKYLGATAQADIVGKAGINKVIGASWDLKNGMPFLDPVSSIPVSFWQTNIIGGGNIFPDGFDLGVFAGQSDSEMISRP